jgi:hypothetical protein
LADQLRNKFIQPVGWQPFNFIDSSLFIHNGKTLILSLHLICSHQLTFFITCSNFWLILRDSEPRQVLDEENRNDNTEIVLDAEYRQVSLVSPSFVKLWFLFLKFFLEKLRRNKLELRKFSSSLKRALNKHLMILAHEIRPI